MDHVLFYLMNVQLLFSCKVIWTGPSYVVITTHYEALGSIFSHRFVQHTVWESIAAKYSIEIKRKTSPIYDNEATCPSVLACVLSLPYQSRLENLNNCHEVVTDMKCCTDTHCYCKDPTNWLSYTLCLLQYRSKCQCSTTVNQYRKCIGKKILQIFTAF